MLKKAVVDKDIDGWGKEKHEDLGRLHSEIIQVGKHESLLERTSDQEIATFCRENECDLYTSDMRFYEHYFKAGVDSVKITNFDWWKNKYILLIQIERIG
jgi:hypothetical protein